MRLIEPNEAGGRNENNRESWRQIYFTEAVDSTHREGPKRLSEIIPLSIAGALGETFNEVLRISCE